MKMLDTNHRWFRPLWVRLVLMAFLACWTVFEFVWGSPMWGVLVAVFAALSFYGFFLDFNPQEPPEGEDAKGGK